MYVSGNFVAGVRSFKSWVVAAVAVLVAVLFWLSSCGVSLAAEQVRLDNGDLVFEEVVEKRRIPGVPAGLTAEQARQLVSGEVSEVEFNKLGALSNISGLLPVTAFIAVTATVATYDEGDWVTTESVTSSGPVFNWVAWVMTAVFYVLAIISALVGIASIAETRLSFRGKTFFLTQELWLVIGTFVAAFGVAYLTALGLVGWYVVICWLAVIVLGGVAANELVLSEGEGAAWLFGGPISVMGVGSMMFTFGAFHLQAAYLAIVVGGTIAGTGGLLFLENARQTKTHSL